MDDLLEASFPFPIADTADGPAISYSRGELTLTYIDYTETRREASFGDVAFFCVSSIDANPRDLLDDRSYVVNESSLIERLVNVGDIDDPHKFKHQIICFNETGQFLEVVFRDLRAK